MLVVSYFTFNLIVRVEMKRTAPARKSASSGSFIRQHQFLHTSLREQTVSSVRTQNTIWWFKEDPETLMFQLRLCDFLLLASTNP